jgi:hypothetical protein
MNEKEQFVGGVPGSQVDPAQAQDATNKVLKHSADQATPTLDTFAQLQARRAARLSQTAKAMGKQLGTDHPDVIAIESMAKSVDKFKTRLNQDKTRAKRWQTPRPNEWIVFGTVLDAQGKPTKGMTVRVFDKDRKYDDLLGEAETDEFGDFSVIYHERDFKETHENLPELYVMVNDTNGRPVYSSKDSLRYQAGRSEYFAIRLGEEKKPASTRKPAAGDAPTRKIKPKKS